MSDRIHAIQCGVRLRMARFLGSLVQQRRDKRAIGKREPASLVALMLAVGTLCVGCLTSVNVSTMTSFSSVDGRFSVTVPGGAMTETTFEGSGPFAGSTIHAFSTTPEGGPRYAVLYGDASADYVATTTVEEIYAAAEAGNVSSTGGTQTAERAVEVAGLPGREQRVITDAKSYVFRLVLVGNRSYAFSVTGSAAQVDAAEATVFLDSFESTQGD
jgi:hypothetical protein